jgi:hypothetical protein
MFMHCSTSSFELRASSVVSWLTQLPPWLLCRPASGKSLTKRTSSSGSPTGSWLTLSHTPIPPSATPQVRCCQARRTVARITTSIIYLPTPNPFPEKFSNLRTSDMLRGGSAGISLGLFRSSRCPVSFPRNIEPFQLQWASQVYKLRTQPSHACKGVLPLIASVRTYSVPLSHPPPPF